LNKADLDDKSRQLSESELQLDDKKK
jgi:chromosome segregation ATPase